MRIWSIFCDTQSPNAQDMERVILRFRREPPAEHELHKIQLFTAGVSCMSSTLPNSNAKWHPSCLLEDPKLIAMATAPLSRSPGAKIDSDPATPQHSLPKDLAHSRTHELPDVAYPASNTRQLALFDHPRPALPMLPAVNARGGVSWGGRVRHQSRSYVKTREKRAVHLYNLQAPGSSSTPCPVWVHG